MAWRARSNIVARLASIGMRRPATVVGALAILFGIVVATPPASAVEHLCHIGKPAYCFKYGQMFCLKDNSLPEREQACVDWTAACLQCHAAIPQCLGGTRPPHSAPLCRSCDNEWRACMHAIDDIYWPNRRKKSSE